MQILRLSYKGEKRINEKSVNEIIKFVFYGDAKKQCTVCYARLCGGCAKNHHTHPDKVESIKDED